MKHQHCRFSFLDFSDALWICAHRKHTRRPHLNLICLCWILLFSIMDMKQNQRWSPAGIKLPARLLARIEAGCFSFTRLLCILMSKVWILPKIKKYILSSACTSRQFLTFFFECKCISSEGCSNGMVTSRPVDSKIRFLKIHGNQKHLVLFCS